MRRRDVVWRRETSLLVCSSSSSHDTGSVMPAAQCSIYLCRIKGLFHWVDAFCAIVDASLTFRAF